MNLETLKAEYKSILEKAKTENRSMNADETTKLDGLKVEIEKLEREAAAKAEVDKRATELRSIAAAQETIRANLGTTDKNTYLRSISKGGSDVGNREVLADVVRQFETESPIFKAHGNVQKRSTGNAFSFTKIVPGGAGYVKSEGVAGTTDSSSSATIASVVFKLYSSQKITVTTEMLDDAAADIAGEVITLGSSKSTQAFDADAVTALESAVPSPVGISGVNWTLNDLIGAFYEIPNRNRIGIKFVAASDTAAEIVGLLNANDAPKTALIGLTPENIIVDDNISANRVYLANPTLALAIGMKTPVRVFTDEVSEGRAFEIQPRLAVALRDATAVSAREKGA